MTTVSSKLGVTESLEDRIFQRIRELESADAEGKAPVRDADLESDIYKFLYQELRGVATELPGMGWQANDPRRDLSCRFSSVLAKAFTRILDRCPEKLTRAKTRKHLTGYVSRTMSNMMLNHIKRKKKFNRIVEAIADREHGDAVTNDILSRLTYERAEYFEARTGMLFEKALRLIAEWDNSPKLSVRNRATVLRLRYCDGLSYDDIALEMNIDSSAVEKLLEQAKYHLRKLES